MLHEDTLDIFDKKIRVSYRKETPAIIGLRTGRREQKDEIQGLFF